MMTLDELRAQKREYYQVGARGGGSKRTFLDAVRACAEIIERETRG